ncbi:hypothetical protein ACFL27_28000 [candidate division CSSED10-310 bacterium]|uniref:Transmembrane protein n=1 Tax=candidate division CSSED10-310 bacterium TaxID=2855610 RepID=A0ABV6Z6H0_UNCC1
MRTSTQSAETGFNYQHLLWILIVFFCALCIYSYFQEQDKASKEKEIALAKCQENDTESSCQEKIEAHHDKCFNFNYKPASRGSPAQFNRAQYYQCLMMGPEEWLQDRKKQYLQQLKNDQKIQEIIDQTLE